MTKRFTGWHMTAILVAGFGVVFAVNFFMASLAIGSFGGVVVENSYVASQNFNGWLEEARRENRLGWTATVGRDGDGHLTVATSGVPAGTTAVAEVRHPLGREDTLKWTLEPLGDGRYASAEPLPEGRWLVRLTLTGDGRRVSIERPVG